MAEGPCGGNNGFEENVLYDARERPYWDMLSQMSYYEYPLDGGAGGMYEVCRKVANREDAVPPGFVIMSMADVRKHYDYCNIGEWEVVALSDGKYEGYGYSFILDQRLRAGNYLGCSRGELLIMTSNIQGGSQYTQTHDWHQPCPAH